jgi:aminobutyraldehyde dehydrogenase
VAAATRAFETYSRTSPAQRSGLMLKLADRIEAEAEDFAALEALNCGKPFNAVLNDEMPAVVDCLRFFAGAARVMPGSAAAEYLPGYTSMIRRDPIGVVGSITPWNYPLMMAVWKIGPALAAGNTMVLKPSEMTPLTTLKLGRVIAEIYPEGVFNVVVGRGQSVGDQLINHPGIEMLSLTGSIGTGRKVLEAASKSIKRTHLELGGKAPVIVFDDADLDAVVSGLKAFSFYNAGRTAPPPRASMPASAFTRSWSPTLPRPPRASASTSPMTLRTRLVRLSPRRTATVSPALSTAPPAPGT